MIVGQVTTTETMKMIACFMSNTKKKFSQTKKGLKEVLCDVEEERKKNYPTSPTTVCYYNHEYLAVTSIEVLRIKVFCSLGLPSFHTVCAKKKGDARDWRFLFRGLHPA